MPLMPDFGMRGPRIEANRELLCVYREGHCDIQPSLIMCCAAAVLSTTQPSTLRGTLKYRPATVNAHGLCRLKAGLAAKSDLKVARLCDLGLLA